MRPHPGTRETAPNRITDSSGRCLTGRHPSPIVALEGRDRPRQPAASMPPSVTPDVTALLRAWSKGDRTALDELFPVVYRELHRQAERHMRAQSAGHTLQATALVHEA